MNSDRPVVRKRNYQQSFADVNHDKLDERQVKCIKFQNNDGDIVLDKKVYHTYSPSNCRQIDRHLLCSSDYWHQVIVRKNRRKINFLETQNCFFKKLN